jgi:ferritin-like metal-binding protein YciE
MEDFEVHPAGTAERIRRLEQELNMYRSKVNGADRKSSEVYATGDNLMLHSTGDNVGVGVISDW